MAGQAKRTGHHKARKKREMLAALNVRIIVFGTFVPVTIQPVHGRRTKNDAYIHEGNEETQTRASAKERAAQSVSHHRAEKDCRHRTCPTFRGGLLYLSALLSAVAPLLYCASNPSASASLRRS